jgi:hypothetical protein
MKDKGEIFSQLIRMIRTGTVQTAWRITAERIKKRPRSIP